MISFNCRYLTYNTLFHYIVNIVILTLNTRLFHRTTFCQGDNCTWQKLFATHKNMIPCGESSQKFYPVYAESSQWNILMVRQV